MKKVLFSVFLCLFTLTMSVVGVVFVVENSMSQPDNGWRDFDSSDETGVRASGYWTTYVNSGTEFAGGNGSASNPYQIATPEQLAAMAYNVNRGVYTSSYFKLTNDIDLAAHYWVPIGVNYAFVGKFNGDNYTISNMSINTAYSSSFLCNQWATDDTYNYDYYVAGLFGVVSNSAIIQNVILYKPNITATATYEASNGDTVEYYSGFCAAVAFNDSTSYNVAISNFSAVSGAMSLSNLKGYARVGGVVGWLADHCTVILCNLTDCRMNVSTGGSGDDIVSGGIVGYACCGNNISYNYFTGYLDSYARVCGGIVGEVLGGSSSKTSYVRYNYVFATGLMYCGIKNGFSGGIVGYATCYYNYLHIDSNFFAATYTFNSGSTTGSLGTICGSASSSYGSTRIYLRNNSFFTSSYSAIGTASGVTQSANNSFSNRLYPSVNNTPTWSTFFGNSTYVGSWSEGQWKRSSKLNSGMPVHSWQYSTICVVNGSEATISGNLNNNNYSLNTTTATSTSSGNGAIFIYAIYGTPITVKFENGNDWEFVYWSLPNAGVKSSSATYNFVYTKGIGFGGNNNLTARGKTNLTIYQMKGISDIRQPAIAWIGNYKQQIHTWGDSVTVEAAPASGYSFGKWTKTNNQNATAVSTSSTFQFSFTHETKNLYAWGEANTYTCTFNGNGGRPSQLSMQIKYGALYENLPTATRDGYTFAGWWTEASGGGHQIIEGQSYSSWVVGNHTLYARWNVNYYWVNINIYDTENQESGQATARFVYSKNKATGGSYDVTASNEPSGDYAYAAFGSTIKISNISPTSKYKLKNVASTEEGFLKNNNDGTYTFTVDGTGNINIQLEWQEYNVNLNIISPDNTESKREATVKNLTIVNPNRGTETAASIKNEVDIMTHIAYSSQIRFSITPDSGFKVGKVSTSYFGTLLPDVNGVYRFTFDFDRPKLSSGFDDCITIQLLYENTSKYDEKERYYYFEDGEYPQNFAIEKLPMHQMYADIKYNNKEETFTLNGEYTGGKFIHEWKNLSFKEGQVYSLYTEVLSGTITGSGCFCLEIYNSSGALSDRCKVDFSPRDKKRSFVVSSLAAQQGSRLVLWIWDNNSYTFNNAKIKLQVFRDIDQELKNKLEAGDISFDTSYDYTYSRGLDGVTIYDGKTYAYMESGDYQSFVSQGIYFDNSSGYYDYNFYSFDPIRWQIGEKGVEGFNTVEIDPKGGWEIAYIPVKVQTNTNYTVSVDYETPNFTPLGGYFGIGLLVTNATPSGDCNAVKINRFQMAPNAYGTASITFNTGNYSVIYIAINGGYINDGQGIKIFRFGNWKLTGGSSVGFNTNMGDWETKAESGSIGCTDVPSSFSFATSGNNYGKNLSNLTVVSADVLSFECYHNDVYETNYEGWDSRNSYLYKQTKAMNDGSNGAYGTLFCVAPRYSTTSKVKFDRFASKTDADYNKKVITQAVDYNGIRVASLEEISAITKDYRAKISDIAWRVVGCDSSSEYVTNDGYVGYWLRDLNNLGSAKVITNGGAVSSKWLSNDTQTYSGVRYSMTMKNASFVCGGEFNNS